MRPTIAAGLESTLDVWVTFPSLGDFARFAQNYKGRFTKHVRDGYETVKAGRGDEVSVDGEVEDIQKLVRRARNSGANVRCMLGGNGAQEAAALKALGANVIFTGGIFPNQMIKLSLKSRRFFEGVNFSFAHTSKRYNPISFILQAPGTNRYILCEGRGRRIDQLRPYMQKMPSLLKQILDKYGRLDMVNLVGWHVLFANGISDRDFSLIEGMIRKIRDVVDSPLFTDAGGLTAFSGREKHLLCRIYSMFDILSVNEDEVLQVSRVLGGETGDEFQAMRNILNSPGRLSTIWLHSLDYQASLSTKYGRELLERAQVAAAAAGVYRVERGIYPSLQELIKRRGVKDYSQKGLMIAKEAVGKYAGKVGNAKLVVIPCYKARSFTSTVGAGDVAAAAYTHTITGGDIRNLNF
jgi:hypothetical protein